MGVTNYVIRPINWDEHGKRVKTDKRDAHAMVLALDGYLRGNTRSFSVVRVPTEAEERLRSVTRQRESLMSERKRVAAEGRGIVLYYGYRLKWGWWRPLAWKRLPAELPDYLIALLGRLRALLVTIEAQLKDAEEALATMSQPPLPKGMGTVLFQQMEREVCDWNRFRNRKQVGGFTGLSPCEDSSADRRFQGAITKHGNPRLRRLLIETVWLFKQHNPGYRGLVKWQDQLRDEKLSKARLKKIVVAIARQFAVDWWRVRTGQIEPEPLGLVMKPAA
jgi:transposase